MCRAGKGLGIGECEHMKKHWLMVGFIVMLTGCAGLEEGGFLTPPPATSKYFRTAGAGFGMDTGKPGIETTYFLDLEVTNGLENGAYLEAHFEDPSKKNIPIVVTQKLNPGEREIIFQSPEIHGLKSFEGYVTEVFIYDNERKDNLIGKHRQVIQSIIDEAELQRRIQQSK